MVYYRAGNYDAAANLYHRILALDTARSEAWYLLGSCRQKQDRSVEAMACFAKVLALQPDNAGAHYNTGFELMRQNRPDEAAVSLERALALMPAFAEARYLLGYSRLQTGRYDEAIGACRQAIAAKPDYAAAFDTWLFALLYRSASTPEEITAAHRAYAERFETPLKPHWPVHANARDPERRLRIGYLSPDFHYHSVAFFVEPVLAHHDRSRFEIHGYHDSAIHDGVTDRFIDAADRWIPCAGMTDEALAERIRSDGIDILVDLAGHSGNNRLQVFARKPAPVQVTWVGYPATTGLTAMDYRLTTEDVDPAGSERWHSEALYRLPRTLWCYRPPEDEPAPDGDLPAVAEPADSGDGVTFGSINNLSKLTPETLALWARILGAIPDARLLMTNLPEGVSRERVRSYFIDQGVAAGRLAIHGKLTGAAFRACMRRIDIMLDPFPYNGTTSTCESLWRGIPVVTLAGATSVGRSGYALLKQVGLEALCAADEVGYVRIACDLARDPAHLRELRAGLRARMTDSPLRDEPGVTREIEDAYRTMWRRWCAS